MDDRPDYYRILHVAPDAPEAIIKSSYRTLMQRLKKHPDLGGDHDAAALINEAHAALTDPEKRADYDRKRQTARHAEKTASKNRSAPQRKRSAPQRKRSAPQARPDYGKSARVSTRDCLFCRAPHELGQGILKDTLCYDCGSPMSLPAHHAPESTDRRALSRIPRNQPITFYTSWPSVGSHSGMSHDISLKGMQFVTKRSLREGEIIKIDCAVCRAVARVVHARQSGNSSIVGVEFVALRFEQTQGSFVSARA